MFIADTSLPSTAEDDGSMRVDTFNAANGEPGVRKCTHDPRASARQGRSKGLKRVGAGKD